MSAIEKRGKNTYRLRVYTGSDSAGKKKYYDKSIDLTHIKQNKQREEAERQFILFKDEVEKGLHLDAGKITFGEFTYKWLSDYAQNNLAPKTLFSYKDMIEKRIIPALGYIKLNKIQPNHLLQFYNNLREEGIRMDVQYRARENFLDVIKAKDMTVEQLITLSGISRRTILRLVNKPSNTSAMIVNRICATLEATPDMLFETIGHTSGLSGRTILYYHRIISSILTSAVQWQYIVSNPADRVKPPKVEKKEARHFDLIQTEYILNLLNNEPLKYRVAVYLCIFGGLRTGELNALEWDDINWDAETMCIDKASQYLPGQGTFTKSTKNLSSERIISLPHEMISLLREYKLMQNGIKVKLGELWHENNRLFTQYDGKPIFPSTLGSWFTKFIKHHNNNVMMDVSIPKTEKSKYLLDRVSIHGLRHTSATLLIGQNIDIATVSRRLGHANVSTTLNIYTHALTKIDRTASDSLGSLFSKNEKTHKKHS